MGYSEQFRIFRETRGLTREGLALHAGCHRNTVLNVESGRPVKFSTIIMLMGAMGYRADSPEIKLLALQWLEAVTGVNISESELAAPAKVDGDGRHRGASLLQSELSGRRLTRDEVDLLVFAARHRKVLNALRAIRDLLHDHDRGGIPSASS